MVKYDNLYASIASYSKYVGFSIFLEKCTISLLLFTFHCYKAQATNAKQPSCIAYPRKGKANAMKHSHSIKKPDICFFFSNFQLLVNICFSKDFYEFP